jgi:hypothetical protein
MNITLRKASTLQNSINDALKSIDVKTDVALTEFHDVDAELVQAHHKARSDVVRKAALIDALHSIRGRVAVANHSTNINQLLTAVARVEKQIQLYSGLAAKEVHENRDVLKGKLNKLSESDTKSRIYGYSDTVSTSVFTHADIAEFKKTVSDLKKQKQALQDSVLEANVQHQIELDDVTCATLQVEGLL